MADAPIETGGAGRQAERERLAGFRRECARQSEAIRQRDEWLQAARARLWERTDRMRQAQPPPAGVEDAPTPADAGETDAGGETGGARPAEP